MQDIHRLFIVFRYLTFRRIVNWCKLFMSYLLSFFGLQKKQNCSPYFISIEVSNYCNLHCPECPVGRGQHSLSKPTTFDSRIYEKLINELKSNLLHVIFYFQGEPFLHPQLNELIKFAHQARLYTTTSTNGQFLTDKRAKEIVLSGLDELIVSVDGSTQEVYEKYRVGGGLQKTLEGIKRVVAWKKELKSVTPLVEIQFLVFKNNEHQMKDMKLIAKELGADRLTFKTAQLYDFENGHALMPTKKRFSRYRKGKDGKYHIKGSQPNRCWRLWGGAVVNVQGDVLPCCFDKDSCHSFGNVRTDSFNSCWQNEKASDFRARILQNRKQFEICKNCTSR